MIIPAGQTLPAACAGKLSGIHNLSMV